MSPRTWQRIKDVYTEASEIPQEDRLAFIEGAAGSQPEVMAEVLRLLSLDAEADKRIEPLCVPQGMLTAAAERRSFFAGERLAGRYEVRRFLASGGMGEVYEAEDLERSERIAIKTIRPELAQQSHLGWLKREVEAAQRVQHPNVCRVFDLVQSGPHTFLTMELLEGETLAAYLQRHGSLTERQAMPWLRQIVAGLAAAHRAGVIHRDFKPGNVMIVPRLNGPSRVVIMDFGLARHSVNQNQTMMSTQMSNTWSLGIGTPAYMAPEQIEGRKSTKASDIYSLGVVLFEMLTGELPFGSDSPLSMAVRKSKEPAPSALLFAPGLRRSWVQVLDRCLASQPGKRFERVEDILPELESRSLLLVRLRRLRRLVLRSPLSQPKLAAGLALLLVFAICICFFWPRSVNPIALAEWQRGLQCLHSDEPSSALEFFERSAAQRGAPWRNHVDLALAWHGLGVKSRAVAELGSRPALLASESDRAYLKAAEALVAGNRVKAVELLQQRAAMLPNDFQTLADLAWMASGPSERWRNVVDLNPTYAAAHLQIADQAAKDGKWREADGEFQAAQLYFQTMGAPNLVRAASARRGLRRLQHGDPDLARQDLASVAALPAGVGVGTCEHVVVLMAGTKDGFALPSDPIPHFSPRFAQIPGLVSLAKPRTFDEEGDNRQLFLSFPLPSHRICAAKIELHIRRGLDPGGAMNDYLSIGAAPFENGTAAFASIPLWAEVPGTMERTIVSELRAELFANVSRVYASDSLAYLDLMAGDDTTFDYIKLTLFY